MTPRERKIENAKKAAKSLADKAEQVYTLALSNDDEIVILTNRSGDVVKLVSGEVYEIIRSPGNRISAEFRRDSSGWKFVNRGGWEVPVVPGMQVSLA